MNPKIQNCEKLDFFDCFTSLTRFYTHQNAMLRDVGHQKSQCGQIYKF